MPQFDSETHPVHLLELRRLHISVVNKLLYMAVITAGFIGFAAGTIAWAFDSRRYIAIGFAAGNFAGALFWLASVEWLRREWARIGVSHPEPPRILTRYEVRQGNVSRFHRFQNATDEQINKLAAMIARGNVINVGSLERIMGGRAEANRFRDELIEGGYLRWRKLDAPKEGVMLTEKGKAFFLDLFSPTPPAGEIEKYGFRPVQTERAEWEDE